MAEIFQIYNEGNKSWVKMEAGKVLANSKEKFEGVPVKKKQEEEDDNPPANKDSDSGWTTFFDFD